MIKSISVILLALIFIFIIITENVENFEIQEKIPKIIIQTWKDNNIPDKYKESIKSVKKFNPDYKYIYMTDNDIEYFLKKHYPKYYKTYKKLPIKIQKIDFFRYIAVYHYGGFYLDLDIDVFKSFNNLLDNTCVFPIERKINNCNLNRYKSFCQNKIDVIIGQYAFGAEKKNIFMKKLIDNIHNNIDKIIERYNLLKDKNEYKNYVYQTTGPDYVTEIYFNNKNFVKLISNKNKDYFGDYAKHNLFGTWKKK